MDKATALARIEEIHGLRDTDLAKFQSRATQDALVKLYEDAYGTEPADGSTDVSADGAGAVQVGAPDDPGEREGVEEAA